MALGETLTKETAARLMQQFLTDHIEVVQQDNFDVAFYKSLSVLSATVEDRAKGVSAKVVWHSKIPPTYTNQPVTTTPKTSHGAAVAVFFDLTTSAAIFGCNFPGWESTGASRNLNITYLKPPVEGDDVLIEGEVVQIGRRLATIRGVMKRQKDGAVLAICQHDKFMADKPHYVVRGKL